MGVQGLWELLTPVGRRISVDSLGSRKLAIDASIWIIQFMKAMRDDKGDMIRNAHLLGFFRRICKLLFLRIKPVFVFDGGTPALKRKTVIARRRQRENAQAKVRKTAEKLLLNHLRTRKLEEIISEVGSGHYNSKTQSTPAENGSQPPTASAAAGNPGSTGSPYGQVGSSSLSNKSGQEAADALLAATLAAELEEKAQSEEGSGTGSHEASDEDADNEELVILPTSQGHLDPTVLASLPPSMQLDLLVQMRENLVAENRQKFQKVAKVPSSFSQLQIAAYLKTVAFRREINEVQKAAAGKGIGGVPTARIASATDREFIFSSSFQGEKPALSSVQEAGSSQQVSIPPPSTQSPGVTGLLSTVARVKQAVAGGLLGKGPDTLETPNEEFDSNSKSTVQTYVDEKGHVRVSRVRGMGVRMTRDLQWNLYLMKDVESRKSLDPVSVSGGPVIVSPLETVRSEPSAAATPEDTCSAKQGLQISFHDLEVSEFGKDDDENLFQELVEQEGALNDNIFLTENVSAKSATTEMMKDSDDEECEWVDGCGNNNNSGGVITKEDLAEAMRQSLGGDLMTTCKDPLVMEAGPISEESEVEWEDGSGDFDRVTLTELDGSTVDQEKGRSLASEEAELEEAIRRSLEDFAPTVKGLSALVIKEPSDHPKDSCSARVETPSCVDLEPPGAESEELYLARERTRKGKAVLDGDHDSLPFGMRPQNAADLIKTSEVQGSAHGHDSQRTDAQSLVSDPTSTVQKSIKSQVAELLHVQSESLMSESVGDYAKDPEVEAQSGDYPQSKIHKRFPTNNSMNSAEIHTADEAYQQKNSANDEVLSDITGSNKGISSGKSQTQPTAEWSEWDLIRDAEEMDIARERGKQAKEAADLKAESEALAVEQANLQAELDTFQAGLDRERELLLEEETELRATQRKNERNADSVTGEMFGEVQDLLQMFGLPYIIAPMEAEAQCAHLNTIELVDGVVTDDCDVFLFGARNVYKNIFDDRKYVEAYYMKDVETELGLGRDKLIQMALLLGSDYTEGISGIGIVNAIEVVNAFAEEEGLKKFKACLDMPDIALLKSARRHSLGKGRESVGKVSEGVGTGQEAEEGFLADDAAGDLLELGNLTTRQRTFMSKHRAVSKNWNVPETFPSEAVIAAYVNPQVDKSTEKFSWGRPDLQALRNFCYERFSWNKEKADELLLPVLKEYDQRETQMRLESFYHFNQRFAKIRSRRIQKAVTGITGKVSTDLMEISPHLLPDSPPKKSKSKRASRVGEDGRSSGKEEFKRSKKGGGKSGVDITEAEEIQGLKRGQGRERGKGRNTGRTRKKIETSSDGTDSEGGMDEAIGSANPLKRKAIQRPHQRRSRRQHAQVNYKLEDSEESIGGACSDGAEISKANKDADIQACTSRVEELTAATCEQTIPSIPSRVDEFVREMDYQQHWVDGKKEICGDVNRGESSLHLQLGGGFCIPEDDTNEYSVEVEDRSSKKVRTDQRQETKMEGEISEPILKAIPFMRKKSKR